MTNETQESADVAICDECHEPMPEDSGMSFHLNGECVEGLEDLMGED